VCLTLDPGQSVFQPPHGFNLVIFKPGEAKLLQEKQAGLDMFTCNCFYAHLQVKTFGEKHNQRINGVGQKGVDEEVLSSLIQTG